MPDACLTCHIIFQTCIPYWPEQINIKKTYGQIEVELLAVDNRSDFIVTRDLRVSEASEKVTDMNELIHNNFICYYFLASNEISL